MDNLWRWTTTSAWPTSASVVTWRRIWLEWHADSTKISFSQDQYTLSACTRQFVAQRCGCRQYPMRRANTAWPPSRAIAWLSTYAPLAASSRWDGMRPPSPCVASQRRKAASTFLASCQWPLLDTAHTYLQARLTEISKGYPRTLPASSSISGPTTKHWTFTCVTLLSG